MPFSYVAYSCQTPGYLLMSAEPIGRWLKQKRNEKDLTLEKVAERMNTTATSLSRYESGARSTPFDVALQFADAIGVSRREVTVAWVAANGGPSHAIEDVPETTYVFAPDALPPMEGYSDLPPDDREMVDEIFRVAVESALRKQRKGAIGFGADRYEEEQGHDEDKADTRTNGR